MDAETIFSKVQSILENNATLAAYVVEVFPGDRPADSRDLFPNITIEVQANPTERVKNNRREKKLSLLIAPAILIQDKDKQIIGDATFKGIMDIEKDTYAALAAYYPDLDATCLYFQLSTMAYPELESANGRVCLIQGDFYYLEAV